MNTILRYNLLKEVGIFWAVSMICQRQMMQTPEYALTERKRHILGSEHDLPKTNDADARICPNGKKTAYSGQ